MARFRVWLRSHVRGFHRISKNKSRQQDQRTNDINVSLKDLKISTPVLVNQNEAARKPLPALPRPVSMPILSIQEPVSETPRYSTSNIFLTPCKADIMEDTHSISAPSTLVEEIEAAPSLCEDSDEDDTMPEHLWPATPTSPTRFGRRMSFLQILNANADGHYDPIISRPHSFASSTPSHPQPSQARRPSHYSVLSDRNSKRASVISQGGNKRVSIVSQNGSKRVSVQSFNGRRRASVMSVGGAGDRSSGMEWDERRASQRFSRRMSWGFETFSTHTSAYVPVRI